MNEDGDFTFPVAKPPELLPVEPLQEINNEGGIQSFPFSLAIPQEFLHSRHHRSSDKNDESSEGASSSEQILVGTITIFGRKSIVLWFGWGGDQTVASTSTSTGQISLPTFPSTKVDSYGSGKKVVNCDED